MLNPAMFCFLTENKNDRVMASRPQSQAITSQNVSPGNDPACLIVLASFEH